MLKNLRRKAPEKDKLGYDLFKFAKIGEHGFQHKPSAIAYDSKLQLLAIGTRTGTLRVYGKPGVELVAQESSAAASSSIQELFFLEEQGRIISVCDDGEQNSLHLWEINNPYGQKSILEEVKACTLEGRLKKISVCCLSTARECLYIGTEGGHIYVLDLNSFELKDHVIYQDIIMQSLSSEVNKTNGGSVEALQEHPTDPEKLLIGYKKGIIVLWNQDKIKAEGTFVSSQDVESVSWNPNCRQFISAHEHGSLSVWNIPDNEDADVVQETSTPFGPFPCKAIRKVEWHDPTVIFSGGLPRASYGDKHCVSILQGNTVQVVLDFTSKVIDFFSIRDPSSVTPTALVVLCEEEIVVVDLISSEKSFPVYTKPYLACLHSSHITTSTHITNCPDDLWTHLIQAGEEQSGADTTSKTWPVLGGNRLIQETSKKDLMITGHEDGTVKFWDVSSLSFNLLYTIYTGKLFQSDYDDGPPPEDPDEEDWPPFKKVGNFDPFTDDPRFVIQKLLLCPVSKNLIVGGSGGQLVIYELHKNAVIRESAEMVDINVIANLDGFEWKGLGPLSLRTDAHDKHFGPVPVKVLQLKPSAPITAVAMESAWGLVAAGTCHGLIVYDIISGKVALIKCTVNPTDLANTGAGIQRKRTLAKSLRDSFRRLRSRRGSKKRPKPEKHEGTSSPNTGVRSLPAYEAAPQTRLIDENRVDEAVLSMVRCLYFGETFLGDADHLTPTLWAGTNAGYIYVYSVTIPDKTNRDSTDIKTEVGKELKLKHHAPVVNIFVVDRHGVPIASVAETTAGRMVSADMTGGHSVVISSEEQFKVFSLPGLRPRNKEKLTAVDGSRVRKLGIMEVKGKVDGRDVIHHCLVCLTNLGDVAVYSIPNLKVQIKKNIIKREDIGAISSLLFTRSGEGFFLKSPSEMQRFCLISANTLTSDTIVKLKRGMRPDEDERDDEEEREPATSPASAESNHILSGEEKEEAEPVTNLSNKSIDGDEAVAAES